MIKLLIHWFRCLTEPTGRNTIFIWPSGRYYVLYPDGKRSTPMSYDVACDYREMFGGIVKKRAVTNTRGSKK